MDLYRDSYNSTYIASAATTSILGATTGQHCKLIRIVVGETAAGAIRVYDAATGATASASNQKAELKASIVEGTYDFNMTMAQGIQVVTIAGSKITVVWSRV